MLKALPNIDVLSDLSTIFVAIQMINKDCVPLVDGSLAKDTTPEDVASLQKFMKDALTKINSASQNALKAME